MENSLSETCQKLTEAYGEKVMSRTQVKRWYKEFVNGRVNVQDKQRSGRPSLETTDKSTLQKKWKNLRDSYIKLYKKSKSPPFNSNVAKPGHYLNYSQLSFLQKCAENSILTTPSSLTSAKNTNIQEKINRIVEETINRPAQERVSQPVHPVHPGQDSLNHSLSENYNHQMQDDYNHQNNFNHQNSFNNHQDSFNNQNNFNQRDNFNHQDNYNHRDNFDHQDGYNNSLQEGFNHSMQDSYDSLQDNYNHSVQDRLNHHGQERINYHGQQDRINHHGQEPINHPVHNVEVPNLQIHSVETIPIVKQRKFNQSNSELLKKLLENNNPNPPREKPQPQPIETTTVMNQDEDKMFCLSLYKELIKVPEEKRLHTKIELLNVLQRAQTTISIPSPPRVFLSSSPSTISLPSPQEMDIPSPPAAAVLPSPPMLLPLNHNTIHSTELDIIDIKSEIDDD